MNQKGFTLAELLAVLAILAIIILVAVPSFNKYVINSEEKYYKTLESTVRTAGMEYMSENSVFLPQKINHYSTISMLPENSDGIIESLTDSEGNECTRADVVVKKNKNGNYEYETCLVCGNYSTDSKICRGDYEDWNGSEGENDKTAPDVTDVYVDKKTTNSITVKATCFDRESKISKYIYYMSDGNGLIEKKESTSASYKFDNLTVNKKYNFKVECLNEAGLKRESKDVDAATPKFTNPTFTFVKTKNNYPIDGFKYSPERDVKVTYNDYNVEKEDVKYFVRSTVDVDVNVDIYKCNGDLTSLDQNNCLTPAEKMNANTWYQVDREELEAIVTFATNTDKGNHTIYAQIGDGINLSGIVNEKVEKIDVSYPTISVISNPKTLNKQVYDFKNNVKYTFGFSGGKVKCNPTSSKGSGTYSVTCTAVGNNGLEANPKAVFSVKHSYPPTWTTIRCNEHDCCWNCHEETSCHCNGGWKC